MNSDLSAQPDNPEAIWAALQSATEQGAPGWRLIRWSPKVGRSLFAGIEPGTGRRVVLLPLDGSEAPPVKRWPHCAGLDPVAVAVSGSTHIGVALKDYRNGDVFDALAVDLARRVESALTAKQAAEALLGQMMRWQKFLSSAAEGLRPMAQRGLWGELHCLAEALIPKYGVPKAVASWKGGERAHQDFQFEKGAIEVKTTIAKQPQAVRITSERQLDDRSWPTLKLHVLVLESHESSGETLPGLVGRIRGLLAATQATLDIFEEQLLESRYLDAHAQRYESAGYFVRNEHWFSVANDFPRIVEGDLDTGVGDVAYLLSLSACEAFRCDRTSALDDIAE